MRRKFAKEISGGSEAQEEETTINVNRRNNRRGNQRPIGGMAVVAAMTANGFLPLSCLQ